MVKTDRSIPLRYRLFLSFSTIVVALTLLFWVLSLSYLDRQMKDNQRNEFLQQSEWVHASLATKLEQAWQFADGVTFSTFARNLCSGYYAYTPYDLAQYQTQLYTSVSFHPTIEGIFIYYPRMDIVFSNLSLLEGAELFFQYAIQCLPNPIDLQREMENTPYRRILSGELTYADKQQNCLLLLQTDATLDDDKAARIGLLLPLHRLMNGMELLNDSMSLCICSESGQLVIGQPMDDDAIHTLARQATTEWSNVAYAGNHYYAMRRELGYGVSVLISQPEASFASPVEALRAMVSVLLAAILALCVTVVFWLSKRFGNSVSQLLNLFGIKQGVRTDELKAIRNETAELLRREEQLREKLLQVGPRYRQYLLQNLLEDAGKEEALRQAIRIADLPDAAHGMHLYVSLSSMPCPVEGCDSLRCHGFWIYLVYGNAAAIDQTPCYRVQVQSALHLHAAFGYATAMLIWDQSMLWDKLLETQSYGVSPECLRALEAALRLRIPKQMIAAIEQTMSAGESLMSWRCQAAFLCIVTMRILPDAHGLAAQTKAQLEEAQTHEQLKQIVTELVLYATERDKKRTEDEKTIAYRQKILDIVHAQFQNVDFSLECLAEQMGLHKSYLSGLIGICFQTGFVDLINQLRIDYSLTILGQNERTIEQVAEESGFQSAASYRRVFKRYYEMSPAEYVAVQTKHRLE